MSKQAKWTPLERHNAQCETDFCQLHKAAPQMVEALQCAAAGLEALHRLHPGACSLTALPMAFLEYAKIARAALRAAGVES